MITKKMSFNIRGVSPFEKRSKAKGKPTKKDKIDVCLACEKIDCTKGYCEKFRR